MPQRWQTREKACGEGVPAPAGGSPQRAQNATHGRWVRKAPRVAPDAADSLRGAELLIAFGAACSVA